MAAIASVGNGSLNWIQLARAELSVSELSVEWRSESLQLHANFIDLLFPQQ